jgi:predicted XRE-type DNA-binding protein
MNADAKGFDTAWDALGRPSEDIAHLRARAELMIALTDHIAKQGWTQSEAAARLGVTQPRISDLTRGKFNAFGLDHLVTMLTRAGMTVDIRVRKRAGKRAA